MPTRSGIFKFGTFWGVPLNDSKCIFPSGPSLILCNTFFMLFIFLVFLLCSFHSHILLQTCFASFASRYYLLMHSPPTCLLEFSFNILGGPVLFVLLDRVYVSFTSPFFHLYLLLWSFNPNISLHVFPSLVLSLVVIISLPVLLT